MNIEMYIHHKLKKGLLVNRNVKYAFFKYTIIPRFDGF